MIRLQEFLDGERDFDDALTLEEYVVDVVVLADGRIVDANGNCLGDRTGWRSHRVRSIRQRSSSWAWNTGNAFNN